MPDASLSALVRAELTEARTVLDRFLADESNFIASSLPPK